MGMAKHSLKSNLHLLFSNPLTLQVIGTGAVAGVDNTWEQEKLEARKLLENAADSPASSARCVGRHVWKLSTLPPLFYDESLTYLIAKALQTSFNRLPTDGFT